MTKLKQPLWIILITSILITGSVAPYSFATEDDDDDDYECEKPSIFTVKYEGPDNASVEIYKQVKHAKNSQHLLHTFSNVNNGDELTLNSVEQFGEETIKSRTTYKILKSSGDTIISIPTSCKKPISLNDIHDKDDVKLTIISGTDVSGIPVIFDRYHYNTGSDEQVCTGTLIDFSTLQHGSNHDAVSFYLNDAFGIDYAVQANNPIDEGTIYDSTTTGGADPDLESPQPINPEIKNLLIIAENNNDSNNDGILDNPDDEANGGKHILEFAVPVELKSLRVIDIENNEEDSMIYGTLADGSGSVGAVMPVTGDHKQKLMNADDLGDLVGAQVNRLEFDLAKSGGIANICIKESEPPTLKVTKLLEPNEDPGLFNLLIDGTEVATSVGHQGTTGDIEVSVGTHVVSETASGSTDISDYTVSFSGDCDSSGSVSLESGQSKECIITNTRIIPPEAVLTIHNSVTTDNGGDASAVFGISVTPVIDAPNGIEFGEDITVEAGIPIEITLTLPAGQEADFTRVLISGDNCPAVSDFDNPENKATIILSADQHLICTVYHDDNGDGASGGSGVIFHFANQQFSLDGGVQQTGTGNLCGEVSAGPCITIDGQNVIVVPDLTGTGQELTDTTIVIFTIIPIGAHINPMVEPPQAICTFDGLGEPFDNGALLGFRLNCQAGLDGNTSFNVNYALIETT